MPVPSVKQSNALLLPPPLSLEAADGRFAVSTAMISWFHQARVVFASLDPHSGFLMWEADFVNRVYLSLQNLANTGSPVLSLGATLEPLPVKNGSTDDLAASAIEQKLCG